MKKVGIIVVIFLCSSYAHAQQLNNKLDSVSYALGIMMGQNLKQQGIKEVNIELFIKAFAAVSKDSSLLFTKDQAMFCLNNFVAEMRVEENKEKIDAEAFFLEENAKNEGVITLESGLQYKVLAPGDDSLSSPLATDEVWVHYEGKLIDGSVFDSSIERGEPISLPVNGVIKGWQEALKMMKPGDKWEVFIPYTLGYGERGAGGAIPPYATLIFTLELLSIAD
jgi:FKBP-type peptidyl-prolyl cis-trans isomerase FklB